MATKKPHTEITCVQRQAINELGITLGRVEDSFASMLETLTANTATIKDISEKVNGMATIEIKNGNGMTITLKASELWQKLYTAVFNPSKKFDRSFDIAVKYGKGIVVIGAAIWATLEAFSKFYNVMK